VLNFVSVLQVLPDRQQPLLIAVRLLQVSGWWRLIPGWQLLVALEFV
jgi:hypothetical protein